MKNYKLILIVGVLLIVSTPLFAYNISIYTDQVSKKKALEVVDTFKNTYPFNQFDIVVDIILVKSSQLNCKVTPNIPRSHSCKSANIAKDAAKKGIDQAIIVKSSPVYGGSGGSIPVITTNSPARMVLHEYLHTLGLCDEYQFSASETRMFCKGKLGANVAIIKPNPKGYNNDLSARSQHMNDIPWASYIKQSTPITHSNGTSLGTNIVNSNLLAKINTSNNVVKNVSPTGLYEGKSCSAATPLIKTWQSNKEASIMEFLDAGLGAGNEIFVMNILKSRGLRLKGSRENNNSSEKRDSNKDSKIDTKSNVISK